jgi:hypothetical protein
MKKFILSVILFFILFVSVGQKITIKSDFVKNFICTDVDVDTNGFGYVVYPSFEWLINDFNYTEIVLDINSKIMTRSFDINYQTVSVTFDIESILYYGDSISFSFTDYDINKGLFFTSFVSVTTDNDESGDYPIFINYWFDGKNVVGYLISNKSYNIVID